MPNIEKLRASNSEADKLELARLERDYINVDKQGERGIYTRARSEHKIKKDGKLVVEGANLKRNEYGHSLICRFLFLYYRISRISRFLGSI